MNLAGADGRFTADVVLDAARHISVGPPTFEPPAAGIAADGTVVAVWAHDGQVFVASAASAAAFAKPTRLARTGGDYSVAPSLAMRSDGQALLTWLRETSHPRAVRLAVRAASRLTTGAWRLTRDLSSPTAEAFVPQAALGAGGRAVIAWVQTPTGFANGYASAIATP